MDQTTKLSAWLIIRIFIDIYREPRVFLTYQPISVHLSQYRQFIWNSWIDLSISKRFSPEKHIEKTTVSRIQIEIWNRLFLLGIRVHNILYIYIRMDVGINTIPEIARWWKYKFTLNPTFAAAAVQTTIMLKLCTVIYRSHF